MGQPPEPPDSPGPFLQYRLLPDFQAKDVKRNRLFVAYSGGSMNPTLREPELLEVVPYQGKPIRRGDVIYFTPQGEDASVVHRVAGITGRGVQTRGDNNAEVDDWVVSTEQILGRVAAAWRGSKRRPIPGGWRGRLLGYWVRWLNRLDGRISRWLSPIYHRISNGGFFSNMLPECLRPRVIHFQVDGGERFFLCWGRALIGRYDEEGKQWIIRRPYRLIVHDRLLETSLKK